MAFSGAAAMDKANMNEATQIPFAQLGYELIALLITESRVAGKLTEILPQGAHPLPVLDDAPLPYEGQYRIDRVLAQQLSRHGEDSLRFRISIQVRARLNLLFFAFEEQYDISAEPHFDLEISVHRPLTLRFTPSPVSAAHIPLNIQPIDNLFNFAQGQLEEFGPHFLAAHLNHLMSTHPDGIELDLLPLIEQADIPAPISRTQQPTS